MILKVTQLGHPVLRLKAKAVPTGQIQTPAMGRFIGDLFDTMKEYDGVGLAAPQVHVSLAMAVIQVEGNARYPKAPRVAKTVLINPHIRPASSRKVIDWEGCLSIPDFRGKVPRWQAIWVEAYDGTGRKVRFKATGFFARVIQHEWDHLQGKVYLDRMRGFSTLTHLKEYTRYWQKE